MNPESGRALVAHHAVLVAEVVGTSGFDGDAPTPDDGSAPDIVKKLADLRGAAIALQGGGVGYYAKSDFIHLDVGRVRQW